MNSLFKIHFHLLKTSPVLTANVLTASLDVESLFTNIPLVETIENCINDILKNSSKVFNFDQFQLKELLSFATNGIFLYIWQWVLSPKRRRIYAISPTLANAFLCHYEKQWLSSCAQNCLPNVYRIYVDDIFVTFNSPEQLKIFVDCMNSKHSSHKVTLPLEYGFIKNIIYRYFFNFN